MAVWRLARRVPSAAPKPSPDRGGGSCGKVITCTTRQLASAATGTTTATAVPHRLLRRRTGATATPTAVVLLPLLPGWGPAITPVPPVLQWLCLRCGPRLVVAVVVVIVVVVVVVVVLPTACGSLRLVVVLVVLVVPPTRTGRKRCGSGACHRIAGR